MNVELDDVNLVSTLKEEASKYYNLAKDYRRERFMKEESEAYIINKIWLKKWKEYVNYNYVKKNIQYSYYYSQYNNKTYEINVNSHPGKICNNYLLVPIKEFLNDGDLNNPENKVIRHNVDQKKEIKIVNKEIWEFLSKIYNYDIEIKKEGISKKSKYSNYPKKIIEIYYRKFNIIFIPPRSQIKNFSLEQKNIYISQSKSLEDLKDKICFFMSNNEFYKSLKKEELRLWKVNANTNLETVNKFLNEIDPNDCTPKSADFLTFLEYNQSISLEEIELADTDVCIIEYGSEEERFLFEIKEIEIRDGKCEWCNMRRSLKFSCICKDAWYCTQTCLERDKNIHSNNCKKKFEVDETQLKETNLSRKGLVGLQNLGNTCFMNTSLQCISNCYELTQYFLKDYYKNDLNTDNPIGSGGVLARTYAGLLKNLWYGETGVFSPWNFKKAIATFQSMFSGYQQHDTQEFLNYVLDGLHEDLNKVLKKPLVEKDDSKKDDRIKSKEQWIGFLKRNQSFIVEILYGQFKSTLYCPNTECQNVSTTFDPFLSISLPLVAKTETYEVISFFIFYDIEFKPLQLNLQFSVETTIMALRNKVSKLLNIHPFSFLVVKMDSHGSYDHLVSSTALLKINNYYNSANQKPFFLFQIDPKIFYSELNKYYKPEAWKTEHSNILEFLEKNEESNKKLFQADYEEDEEGKTYENICYYSKININTVNGKRPEIHKINTDDNNGFDSNWLKVVIFLKKYDDPSSNRDKRIRIIFPRIIYINKNWSCIKVHHMIFNYFAFLIKKKTKSKETNEELWIRYFNDLDTRIENDTPEFHRKNLFPYRIKMKNIFIARTGNCVFCDKSNCEDCLLPYEDIKISSIIDKIPKNDGLEIDNSFYFLNERQKFYSGSWNRDFSLEVVWLNDYAEIVSSVLNDKRDYNFKIQNSVNTNNVYIYDCFKNFIKLEKLEENNEWYCPECKTHQRATKKMEIYKAPHILIIHLKRFRNNSKIDSLVDFPINDLDISEFVISNEDNLPLKYELFAIANHHGSMGFGHYISYAKNPIENLWYEFDDSHVSRKSESQLITNSAYVLFYRRKGLENYINIDELSKKKYINYDLTEDVDMKE